MTSMNNLESTADELKYGQWISLENVQRVSLSIDQFWSAFDNYLTFLSSLSGRTDVELETGFGKPQDGPGTIVRFNFQGSLVRDRLLLNDRQNYVWRMDIPEATELFLLYEVTFRAKKILEYLTEVKINVNFVLRSEKKEERLAALNTLKQYLPQRIPEIVKFIRKKEGLNESQEPLTECEIKQLAADFYAKLDAHDPVEQLIPFLALETGFEMQFPNGTLENWEQFKEWYENSVNVFFDEVHELKEIQVTNVEDGLEVKAVVYWEASTWNSPESTSKRIIADVNQTWMVIRSFQTKKPLFKRYIVEKMNLIKG